MNNDLPLQTQHTQNHSRILVLLLVALIALYAYMMLINPIAGKKPNLVIFSFHAIPAFFSLFFAFKNTYRGFIWVNYMSMMLFCIAVANILQDWGWTIYAETLLTSCIFIVSLMAGINYKKRAKALEVKTNKI